MITASKYVQGFFQNLPETGRARTLAADRFVDFPNDARDKESRLRTSQRICKGASLGRSKLPHWQNFLAEITGQDTQSPQILFAKLTSRLLVNMAGGVFENGGLSLDRTSGVPFIPGSAIKGCAHRTALAALREWSEFGKPQGDDNPLSLAAAPFDTPNQMLAAVALVFGSSHHDWSSASDFTWALNGADGRPAIEAINSQVTAIDGSRTQSEAPTCSGTICFLPAFPWKSDPGLELDVLTGHHREYYESKDANAVARDTEEPNPVIFPAVRADTIWAFLIHPNRRSTHEQLGWARTWLEIGISSFGIGAKSNAGYGFFDPSADTTTRRMWKAEIDEAERLENESQIRAQQEAARKENDRLQAELDGLPPDVREDKKLAGLTDENFGNKLRNFCRPKGGPNDAEKQAIVRALRGPRLVYWTWFKTKSQRGDLATVEQAVRELSKRMNLGKMP